MKEQSWGCATPTPTIISKWQRVPTFRLIKLIQEHYRCEQIGVKSFCKSCIAHKLHYILWDLNIKIEHRKQTVMQYLAKMKIPPLIPCPPYKIRCENYSLDKGLIQRLEGENFTMWLYIIYVLCNTVWLNGHSYKNTVKHYGLAWNISKSLLKML